MAGGSHHTNPHLEDEQGQDIMVLVPTAVRAGRPAWAERAAPRLPRTPAPERAETGRGGGSPLCPPHSDGAAAGEFVTVGGASSLFARATARTMGAFHAGRDLIAWVAAGMEAGGDERPVAATSKAARSVKVVRPCPPRVSACGPHLPV